MFQFPDRAEKETGIRSGKIYVSVVVSFDKNGNIKPLQLLWSDGRKYNIDKILTVQPAYSLKAGGGGDRYTVRINGKERYLFFEHSPYRGCVLGRWFVERGE